ncbi:MAG: hypothetical protein AAF393_14990 [Pseudomonadota bacterium]
MQQKLIPLTKIRINNANDRHGELGSEEDAIIWLLENRTKHMRNLAHDISKIGEVFEPPLVSEIDSEFVVFDGNRRMTVLKLIANPNTAPDLNWKKFFKARKENFAGDIPKKVQCQIENDKDRLDEILYRRHTGQQDGVGQSQWDNPAKTNFERRTGKKTKMDTAEEIEKALKGAALIPADAKIPRSNLNRLLSSERLRNRCGISIQHNSFSFTHSETKTLAALKRIVDDLQAKRITLDDIWDNKLKTRYLNQLEREGVLPSITDLQPEPTDPPIDLPPVDPPSNPTPPNPAPSPSPTQPRVGLIRNIDYGLKEEHENQRAIDVFRELQSKLIFGRHDNAISVLFRVLLELSLSIYVKREGMTEVHPNDKLKNRFTKVLAHMVKHKKIDKKYRDQIAKFSNNEPIISANSMNSYVHGADFFPSEKHLKAIRLSVVRVFGTKGGLN